MSQTQKPDPYASDAETDALLTPDTRTPAERTLDTLLDAAGYGEQGADPVQVLRRVALDLVEQRQDAKWIDPNDKTQKQYLPYIGERVLFCHKGHVYFGKHTGGSFQSGHGATAMDFMTWDCRWMYPPAAHAITKGST